MNRLFASGTVIALALLLLLQKWPDVEAAEVEVERPAHTEALLTSDVTESVAPLPTMHDQRSQGVASTTDDAPETNGAATELAPRPIESRLASIRGRLVLPDGKPAPGALLSLQGWPANGERAQAHGVPESWDAPTAITDLEGRFNLAFDPPPAFQFALESSTPDHAALSWRWAEIAPGSTTNVGEQQLLPACSVEGRVVGADGAATGTRWLIYASSDAGTTGPGSARMTARTTANPDTGQFRLAGLPEGPVRVRAYSRAANWIDGPELTARRGASDEIRIVYHGPAVAGSIVVQTSCDRFPRFNRPVSGRVVARAADGTEHEMARLEHSSQSYRVGGLPPGPYTVEVESAVHRKWSRANVEPGRTIHARLRGDALVSLSVVDDGTGAPIEPSSVRVRYESEHTSPRAFELTADGQPQQTELLLHGLLTCDATLLIVADGYAQAVVPLGQLSSDQLHRAEARLQRPLATDAPSGAR